jgi:quercetin dioxygenase-like cupin family protein
MSSHELGFFGNIWVRQNVLQKAGDRHGGHKHEFDHVSLLTKGKVRVEVEGYQPKEFTAPTFIIIKKEHAHDFVALEDDVNWYCVFALRDLDGQVVEVFDEAKHNPLSATAKVEA